MQCLPEASVAFTQSFLLANLFWWRRARCFYVAAAKKTWSDWRCCSTVFVALVLTLPLALSFWVFLSFCVLQESGQMEQMAQTSMLRAGHMMDPCWPLLMTLAKCTCSPSPALNQGSVMLTHSDKHKAHQSRGSVFLYARVEICSTSQTRWLSTLPELRSYGVCFSTALWLSFNEHWETQWKLSRNNRIPYHYQACNVHNVCQVFIMCSQTIGGC